MTNINPQELYFKILEHAGAFLHNSKRFSVDVLAEDDPSYETIAELMQNLATIITVLAEDFDPMMGEKAIDYCSIMKKMGIAIKNKDQNVLSKLVCELDKRSFL